MKREEDEYAERQSGELLPRRARQYVPPHEIPERPEPRTLENATVRLDPRVDPRLAMTQLDQRAVRGKRRVWWGLFLGSALGTAVGAWFWFGGRLLPAFSGAGVGAQASALDEGSSSAGLSQQRSVDWASLQGVGATSAEEGEGAVTESMSTAAEGGVVEELDALDPSAVRGDGGALALSVASVAASGTAVLGAGEPQGTGAGSVEKPKAKRAARPAARAAAPGQGEDAARAPVPAPSGTGATPAPSNESAQPAPNQVWVKPKDPKVWLGPKDREVGPR